MMLEKVRLTRASAAFYLVLIVLVLGTAVWCFVAWIGLGNANAEAAGKRKTLQRVYRLSEEFDKAALSSHTRAAVMADTAFSMTTYMDSVINRAGRGQEFKCKTSHRKNFHDKQYLVEQISIYAFQDLTPDDAIAILWLVEADADPRVNVRSVSLIAQPTSPNPKSTIYHYKLTLELSHYLPVEKR